MRTPVRDDPGILEVYGGGVLLRKLLLRMQGLQRIPNVVAASTFASQDHPHFYRSKSMMRAPLQSIRKVDDNELLRACGRAYAGLVAICCVLIVVSLTVQFGDVIARSV